MYYIVTYIYIYSGFFSTKISYLMLIIAENVWLNDRALRSIHKTLGSIPSIRKQTNKNSNYPWEN